MKDEEVETRITTDGVTAYRWIGEQPTLTQKVEAYKRRKALDGESPVYKNGIRGNEKPAGLSPPPKVDGF